MPGGSRTSHGDIPLPTLNVSKENDYVQAIPHIDTDAKPRENAIEPGPLDGNSSDDTVTDLSDFDWDAEDDAQSHKEGVKVKAKRIGAIWRGFMKLARPVRTLLIGALGAGIFITPLLVFKLRFNSSPVRIQAHVWSLWLTITWAAGCITYLLVDLIPSFILRFLKIANYRIERIQITIELTSAVSGWLKLALDIAWAWIALSVIRATYHPPGSYWTIVNRVIQALFSGGVLLLVEKVFLQYVAINFHRKALADRITENKLGLKALEYLSNAQPAPATKRHPYGNRKGHKSTGSFDMLGFGGGRHHHNGEPSSSTSSPIGEKGESPTPINPGRNIKMKNAERRNRKKKLVTSVIVDGLGEAIGQVALKDSKFNRQIEIGGAHDAKRLARKLFSALSDVHPPRAHLVVEDFFPYFRSEVDARAAFALFDKDGNGDISRREMRDAVSRIYKERKALTKSLKDVGSAVAKLDAVMFAVVLMIFVFICLLIFNRSNTLASLVPLATIILGFSFIFGHSAQTLFESLIFIFSTHVFDVGDLVMIDDSPMFVREFGLFSTTFRRVDGQEIIAPNSLLASSKLVHNLRRSSSMWETTELMISYDTPLDVIEQLKIRLQGYVAQNNREWSNVNVNIDKMEYQNAIHLVVGMEHRPNWQDWGGRWQRRTAFMRNLKSILEDLDVKYTMPIQPVLLPKYLPSMAPGSPQLRQPPSPKTRRGSIGRSGSMRSGMDGGRQYLRP
ncbi:hypothetical protein QCA50_010681 [Cerrena zonata]|uniref:EF-hand domain-containing protein n=1 Tax=Cerrena zonata TaxID=2478898 RepID=A0AAW0G999_9APHY